MLQPKTILTSCLLVALVACSSSSGGGGGTTGDSGPGGDTSTGGTDTGSAGTDTGSTGTDTGGGKIDTGSSSTDTGSSSTDTGSSGGDGGGDLACNAAADQKACQQCCHDNHVDAYKAFVSALLTCACKAGNCDTVCSATICAATPSSPDAPCTKCLNDIQGTSCKADLATACGPGGPCAPFNDCIQAQCKGKP